MRALNGVEGRKERVDRLIGRLGEGTTDVSVWESRTLLRLGIGSAVNQSVCNS